MAKRTANRKEMRKVAEAAEAKDKTKEAKTPVVRKKKVGSRRSKSAAAERKRMVWVIYNGAQKEEARYAYADKEQADEKLAQLSAKSSKRMFYIQPIKELLSVNAVVMKKVVEEVDEASTEEE
jgi:hypothetical protein